MIRSLRVTVGLGLILAVSSPAWSQQDADHGQAGSRKSSDAEPRGAAPGPDPSSVQKPDASSGTPSTPAQPQPAAVLKTKTKSNQSND